MRKLRRLSRPDLWDFSKSVRPGTPGRSYRPPAPCQFATIGLPDREATRLTARRRRNVKEESLDITEIFVLALLVEFGLEAGIDLSSLMKRHTKLKSPP